jgi:hypothetical protein
MQKNSYLFLLFCLLLAACKNKPVVKDFKLPEGKGQVVQVSFLYLTAKAKVNYQDSKQNFRSTVEIRAKKDSAIWISFRPALGIELARMLITQDSIKVLDRTKQEEYLYAFKDLQHDLRFDLRFQHIEALLTGNLISKEPALSVVNEADFQLVTQKDKTVAITNYVGGNQKVHKVFLQDEVTNNQATVLYNEFTEVTGKLFPFFSSAVLNYKNRENLQVQAEAEIKYSKIVLSNKPLRFPF